MYEKMNEENMPCGAGRGSPRTWDDFCRLGQVLLPEQVFRGRARSHLLRAATLWLVYRWHLHERHFPT